MKFNYLVLYLSVFFIIAFSLGCKAKRVGDEEGLSWAVISGNELRLSSGYEVQEQPDGRMSIMRVDSKTLVGTIGCSCNGGGNCEKPILITLLHVECDPSICPFCTPVVFISPELRLKHRIIFQQLE